MLTQQLTLISLFQVKPGMEEVAKQAVMALIPQVIAEPTCINVNFHQDPNDKTRFMFYENWADKEVFEGEHSQTPYLQKYLDQSQDFLVEPAQTLFYQIVSENAGSAKLLHG